MPKVHDRTRKNAQFPLPSLVSRSPRQNFPSVDQKLGEILQNSQNKHFLKTGAGLTGFSFIEAALTHLDARYTVDQVEREPIPVSGRVLIIANHPSGALAALVRLHFISSIRRNVKIVASDMLYEFDGVRELVLPLRILGGKPHPKSLLAIERALEMEECVIVFPAGEVSLLSWKSVSDSQSRRGFLHFAKNTSTPILAIKIQIRNS